MVSEAFSLYKKSCKGLWMLIGAHMHDQQIAPPIAFIVMTLKDLARTK